MLRDAGLTVTAGVAGAEDELLPPPQPFGRKKTQKHPIKEMKCDFIRRMLLAVRLAFDCREKSTAIHKNGK
jgi:hypothetical protein